MTEIKKKSLKVYNDLKEILEKMDVSVGEATFATNSKKIGNIGIRCTANNKEDDAWITIKKSYDTLQIVPPLYKYKDLNFYTNESTNKELCDLLNRIAREYVIDNKKFLLNNNTNLIFDMDDLLKQYNLLFKESLKFDNISILRNSFYKDYIEIGFLCRNKNNVIKNESWDSEFYIPIILTKNKNICKRKRTNWSINSFFNREDIYILINKKHLKYFSKMLKDTVLKDNYKLLTGSELKKMF